MTIETDLKDKETGIYYPVIITYDIDINSDDIDDWDVALESISVHASEEVVVQIWSWCEGPYNPMATYWLRLRTEGIQAVKDHINGK